MRAVVRRLALAVGGALTFVGAVAVARAGVNFSDLDPSLSGLLQMLVGLTLVGLALVPRTHAVDR